MPTALFLTSTVTLFAIAAQPNGDEWSRFRGPNGCGILECGEMPSRLDPDSNAIFSVDVPSGRSSPVSSDGLIFLTGLDNGKFILMCLDSDSGETFWRRELDPARQVEMFYRNDSSSPSPVTDGENVYAFFQELGLVAFDAEGRERWSLPLGPFQSYYGVAASPILCGEYVILLCDQRLGGFLLAVDRTTGTIAWKVARDGFWESWTTPVLFEDAQRGSLILTLGNKRIIAYAAETGEQIWEFGGAGPTPVASPIVDGNRLYFTTPNQGDHPMPDFDSVLGHDHDGDSLLSSSEFGETPIGEHFVWSDLDGDGFVSRDEWDRLRELARTKAAGVVAVELSNEGDPRELWRYRRTVPYIATPLLYKDVLYLVKDGGIVASMDPETGKVFKSERIGDSTECYPSPVAADGKIYIANNSGQIVVLKASPEWETLSVNDLGEDIRATPAISAGKLFVRTSTRLHAFGRIDGE